MGTKVSERQNKENFGLLTIPLNETAIKRKCHKKRDGNHLSWYALAKNKLHKYSCNDFILNGWELRLGFRHTCIITWQRKIKLQYNVISGHDTHYWATGTAMESAFLDILFKWNINRLERMNKMNEPNQPSRVQKNTGEIMLLKISTLIWLSNCNFQSSVR